MTSFFDQIEKFDAGSLAALEQIYQQGAATDPRPLSFNGWLLLHVVLYVMSQPAPFSQADLHRDPSDFIKWLADRTAEPLH